MFTEPKVRSSLAARLLGFGVWAAVLGLLASGLFVPVIAVAAWAGDAAQDSGLTAPLALARPALPQTSVMLAADGSVLANFYSENRTDEPLSRIAGSAQDAIVAVEDSRFFEHGAADPRGLARALLSDASGGSTEGGSTLTQQYVKNMLLEQAVQADDLAAQRAVVARTLGRKVRELRLAVSVERELSKQQILDGYLNLVYFGYSSYGIQAAAETYFHTLAAHLSLAQSAFLAGVVQDPAGFDPVADPKPALDRRNLVLADMLSQKMITKAQYATAVATAIKTDPAPPANGCGAAGASGFFCEYVVRSIVTSSDYSTLGTTDSARQKALLTGGLVINTTLQPGTQDAAVSAVNASIPATDPSGLAATAVTVEPGTGAVVAMAQDRSYSVITKKGQTSVNYAVDTALGGSQGFQTGSSFKPFTLAAWLDAGHSLSDVVDATSRAFPFADFTACGTRLRGTPAYRPGNSEGTETGPMSVQQATADSVNVAYVQMESELDLCDIASTAESLGVHLAAPEQECSASAAASTSLPTCLPSLTLGVKDIAPLTMAAAYAGFADGGVFCSPRPVSAISRASAANDATTTPVAASSVLTTSAQCKQALSPAVASGVNTALKSVLTSGTAAAVGPLHPWPSAGKTGTTDGPYDTWFAGYTAQASTAVWVGDPGRAGTGSSDGGSLQRRRLTNITVGGHYYRTVFGASIAAPIWKKLMTAAMHGLPARDLP